MTVGCAKRPSIVQDRWAEVILMQDTFHTTLAAVT